MACSCCNKQLNSGMIHKVDSATGQKFKSCPNCSATNGGEHVFHPYPLAFGKTPARRTARNPDGYQSYCIDCRSLSKGTSSKVFNSGRTCGQLS